LMLLDWNSYKSQRIAELFYIPFRLHQTEYLPSAREMFEENFHALPGKDNESSDDRIKSYRFADFSIALLKMKIVIESMNSEQQYILQVPFLIIDSAINHLYKKGIFKDKIMLLAFLSIDRNEQTNYMNFLDKAIRGATSGQFKKQLTAFRAKNNKGSLAFPFHFADTNGKEHRLSEFAGKLVVMDFWFTGCKGCLQMAPVLRSLAKELKVNPDIVFISVSIDRNSTVWKQSVAKGLYCSLDEVNLLSDNGSSSKILQHYNINSFPTLILISKSGRIVSTTPPDPRLSRQKFDALLMNNL
jgi:thiol-disulfide isomerase/thioredoxin